MSGSELEVLRSAARKAQAEIRSMLPMAWVHGWRTDPANAFTHEEQKAWDAANRAPLPVSTTAGDGPATERSATDASTSDCTASEGRGP